MSTKSMLQPRDVAVAIAIMAIGAIAGGVAFSSLAKPADYEKRLLAIEARTQEAGRLLRPPRVKTRFGAQAACSALSEVEATKLRARLAALGQDLQIELRGVDLRPEVAAQSDEKFAPLRIRFEAVGPYEGLVRLLDGLAGGTPEVFVDVIDMKAGPSNATLAFSGRVLCAI